MSRFSRLFIFIVLLLAGDFAGCRLSKISKIEKRTADLKKNVDFSPQMHYSSLELHSSLKIIIKTPFVARLKLRCIVA